MSSSPSLILYGDMISQPVRSIYWLLKLKYVPFTFVKTSLFDKDTEMDRHSDEYRKIHPFSRVPALVDTAPSATSDVVDPLLLSEDGSFALTESTAILEYLATKFGWEDEYPLGSDAASRVKRARISEYLHQHHSHIRDLSHRFIYPWAMAAIGEKPPMTAEEIAALRADGHKVMQWFEVRLAARANKAKEGDDVFLFGEKPSIADFQAFSEIIAFDIPPFGMGPIPSLRSDHPHVARWLTAMTALPSYDLIANADAMTFFGTKAHEAHKDL